MRRLLKSQGTPIRSSEVDKGAWGRVACPGVLRSRRSDEASECRRVTLADDIRGLLQPQDENNISAEEE